MIEPKFMTSDEKLKALSRCEKRLMRIQCELGIPANMYIDHALQNIELAKLSIQKDQEAWDRVHAEESQND